MSIKIDGFPPSTAGVTGALVYKGSLDPAALPGDITSANKGDFYIIEAAGTIATVAVNINDHIVFNRDASNPLTAAMFDKIDNTEPTASETVAGIIEIATDVEAAAGTANNKALVPSNIDNIKLNQLNDVAYTPDVSIDDYILTYDHSTTSWGAEAAPTAAAASTTVAGVIEIATNGEATAASALDKALVPGNLGSINISTFTNDSGFITSYTETDTLNDVVGRGATTATAIQTGGLTVSGDIDPSANNTHSIGDESNRFISYYGDVNGALRFKAKNDSGGQLTKGQAVYIKGISGTVPTVDKARANAAGTMPAFGLVYANANDQAEVQIITFGNLSDFNTSSFTAGDTVYISSATAGALVNTPPTGESNFIQNIGRVLRSDASAGIIKVGGAGRTNATPNLDQDKVFLGNASNQAASTALSSINLSSFNNDSGFITDIAAASETVAGKIEIATDTEAAAGTATDKALVPSNIDNIKLNQLNDVAYTAGAGIDNYVLTYDHSTTSWGAEAAPTAAAASTTVAGVIEIATNGEATAASALDKALVPGNLGSINISTLNNDSGFITDIAAASTTVAGKIEIATNGEATAASALDKALVPGNLGSINISTLNNDSGFITDIAAASETVAGKIEIATDVEAAAGTATDKALVPSNIDNIKLNQLNDVAYTAGAGIDNYVLTYDHSTTSWGAEAATGGGGGSRPAVTEITSTPYTISNPAASVLEDVYLCDSGASVVNLPTAVGNEGLKVQVKNRISSAITVNAPNPGTQQTIDGSNSVSITTQYESLTFISDNTNWNII